MQRRFTLSECWKLLGADNKSLQRWLERAKIVPQTSEADHRTKYLSREQLADLAAFVGRTIPETPPEPDEPVGPYKLLLDQLNEVRADVDHAFSQAHEAWRTIDSARETFDRETEALRATLEDRSQEIGSLSNLQDLQRQQHTALATLLDEYKRDLGMLTSQVSEGATLTAERNETLEGQFHSLELDLGTGLEQLAQRVEAQGLQLVTQQQLVQGFQNGVGRIEQSIGELSTRIDDTETAEAALTERIDVLTTRLDAQSDLQHQVEELTTALSQERTQRIALEEQVRLLSSALPDLQRQVGELIVARLAAAEHQAAQDTPIALTDGEQRAEKSTRKRHPPMRKTEGAGEAPA